MHIGVFPGGQVGSFPAPQKQGVGPHVVFSCVPNDGSLYPGFLEWLCCVKDSTVLLGVCRDTHMGSDSVIWGECD